MAQEQRPIYYDPKPIAQLRISDPTLDEHNL